MTLAHLADRPEYAPTLAGWYFREWPDLFADEAAAQAEVASGRNRGRLDCILLGLEGSSLVASAALLTIDVLPLPDLGPWLGSVVADPTLRGRGYGRAIVEAAVSEARALDIPRLHLWTPHHREFYEKLGWAFVRRYTDVHRAVDILRLHIT